MIGDAVVTRAFAGLVFSNDGTKTTILGIAGDYLRIGDAGTTSHTLNSEDDLLVTGKLEVDGVAYFGYGLQFTNTGQVYAVNDDVGFGFGAGGTVLVKWETADGNANELHFALPTGGATDVPVMVIGDFSINNADLGLFNGITQPRVAVVDDDIDSYIWMGHSVDDRPTIGGSTYISIGDAAATSQSLSTEDDLLVTGKLEVVNIAYFDNAVRFTDTGQVVAFADDVALGFGETGTMLIKWETADDNANELHFAMPTGGATDVPVAVFGDMSLNNADPGFFHGQTIPRVATIAADMGGYVGFGCDDSDILDIIATTSPVVEADETKFSHKWQCVINGATYYIMLTQT